MQDHEGLAGLEVLVAIAKADGKLRYEERRALEFCLDGITLPAGTTVDALLEKDIDVDAALKQITSAESRQEVCSARSRCPVSRSSPTSRSSRSRRSSCATSVSTGATSSTTRP